MDAYTNVESLHFTFDQEKNRIPIVYIYNQETGISHPDPDPAHYAAESAAGADPADLRRTCFRQISSPSATTCRSCRFRRPS